MSFAALLLSSRAQADAGAPLGCSALTQDSPYVSAQRSSVKPAPDQLFEVVARYPHDQGAFTEGLVFYRGELYESTGIHGRSSVRRVDLASGQVLNTRSLDTKLFGEGLTVAADRLVQLTWKSGSAFIYAPEDLEQRGAFQLEGEGWGLTTRDTDLIISDGSPTLRFVSATDYRQTRSLEVTDGGRPLQGLNELEMVEDFIYANVYPSDCIARIDPESGKVAGWLDLRGLLPLSERPDRSAVANGIAWRPETRELFVTGKFWPYIYQLKLLKTDVTPGKRVASSETGAEPPVQ
jgi:glutaminyl-peptide cyclotransferase